MMEEKDPRYTPINERLKKPKRKIKARYEIIQKMNDRQTLILWIDTIELILLAYILYLVLKIISG